MKKFEMVDSMSPMEKVLTGQAGIEYLLLYGWVLLAALIAIGIIIFVSNFFSPEAMQQRCSIVSFFECSNVYIKQISTSPPQVELVLTLKNTGPDTFRLKNIEASSDGSSWVAMQLAGSSTGLPFDIPPGNESTFKGSSLHVSGDKSPGSMQRIYVKGIYNLCKYNVCSSDIELTGEIVEKIN